MRIQKPTPQSQSSFSFFYTVIGFSTAFIFVLLAWFYLRMDYDMVFPDAVDYAIAGVLPITTFLLLKRKKEGWMAGVVLTVYQMFRLGMWMVGHMYDFALVVALLCELLMGYALFLLVSGPGWRLYFEHRRQMEQKLLVCGGIITLLIMTYFKFKIYRL